MIAAFDREGRFILFNQTYHSEFKHLFNKSVTAGMSLDEALQDVNAEKAQLVNAWKNSAENNQNIEIGVNGERIVYEMITSNIENGDHQIDGRVQIIRNISKRVHEHTELQQSYAHLAQGMEKLEDKNKQINLLVEMSDIMLACSSQDELSHVMTKYSSRMLQFASGYLYVMHPSKNYLEIIASWGK